MPGNAEQSIDWSLRGQLIKLKTCVSRFVVLMVRIFQEINLSVKIFYARSLFSNITDIRNDVVPTKVEDRTLGVVLTIEIS